MTGSTNTAASDELAELVHDLREAREAKALAEAIIKKKMPRYFALLDEIYGKGRVEFEIDGQKYGRIVAEKAKFDAEAFLAANSDLDFLIQEKVTYSLDEEKAKEYLDEHPDAAELLQKYTSITEEARWKPPVEVRE